MTVEAAAASFFSQKGHWLFKWKGAPEHQICRALLPSYRASITSPSPKLIHCRERVEWSPIRSTLLESYGLPCVFNARRAGDAHAES